MEKMKKLAANIFSIKFKDYSDIAHLLKVMEADKIFKKQKKTILKPNIVTNTPYPVTTDPKIAEEFIKFISGCSKAKIIIAEGSMDDTTRDYRELGFKKLGKKYGIELVDLNYADVEILKNEEAKVLRRFHFPKVLKDAFIISLANMKMHHSEAKVTLSLKNMFGIAAGKYYTVNIRGRPWTKEMLHDLGINNSIIDINTYCLPNLGFVDGRTTQLGAELGGPTKKHGKMYASFNPIALDQYCAALLGYPDLDYITELARIHDSDLERMKLIEVK